MATNRYHIEDTIIDKNGNKHILYPKNTINDVYLTSSTPQTLVNKIIYTGDAQTVGGSTQYVMSNTGITSGNLKEGTHISVKFLTNVAVNSTLNVDNTGAKPIVFNGSSIGRYVIRGNDIVDLVYRESDGGKWDVINSHPQGLCALSDESTFSLSKIKRDRFGHVIDTTPITQEDLTNGLNMATKEDVAAIDVSIGLSDKFFYNETVSNVFVGTPAVSGVNGIYLIVDSRTAKLDFTNLKDGTHVTLHYGNLLYNANGIGLQGLYLACGIFDGNDISLKDNTTISRIKITDALHSYGGVMELKNYDKVDLVYYSSDNTWRVTSYFHKKVIEPTSSTELRRIKLDEHGHVVGSGLVTKDDITALGIPAQDTTYTLSSISGTLSAAKGGTGRTSLNSGEVLIGGGTSAVNFRGIDTTATATSSNLITSGAVKNALDTKANTNAVVSNITFTTNQTAVSDSLSKREMLYSNYNGVANSSYGKVRGDYVINNGGTVTYYTSTKDWSLSSGDGNTTLMAVKMPSNLSNMSQFYGVDSTDVSDILGYEKLGLNLQIWKLNDISTYRTYHIPSILTAIITFGRRDDIHYLSLDRCYYVFDLYAGDGTLAGEITFGFPNNTQFDRRAALLQIEMNTDYYCIINENWDAALSDVEGLSGLITIGRNYSISDL